MNTNRCRTFVGNDQCPPPFPSLALPLPILSSDDDQDTVGQRIWANAARVLMAYIEHVKTEFKDKIVLELGSGTGLVGLVAAHYAKSVLLTDFDQITLDLMKKTIELNVGALISKEEHSID